MWLESNANCLSILKKLSFRWWNRNGRGWAVRKWNRNSEIRPKLHRLKSQKRNVLMNKQLNKLKAAQRYQRKIHYHFLLFMRHEIVILPMEKSPFSFKLITVCVRHRRKGVKTNLRKIPFDRATWISFVCMNEPTGKRNCKNLYVWETIRDTHRNTATATK